MIRMQTNLLCLDRQKIRKRYYMNKDRMVNPIEFNCQYVATGLIDLFSVQFNMFMYILQNICGFRAKTFITDEDSDSNYIYVLLSLKH